jgi:hypothetical protein
MAIRQVRCQEMEKLAERALSAKGYDDLDRVTEDLKNQLNSIFSPG